MANLNQSEKIHNNLPFDELVRLSNRGISNAVKETTTYADKRLGIMPIGIWLLISVPFLVRLDLLNRIKRLQDNNYKAYMLKKATGPMNNREYIKYLNKVNIFEGADREIDIIEKSLTKSLKLSMRENVDAVTVKSPDINTDPTTPILGEIKARLDRSNEELDLYKKEIGYDDLSFNEKLEFNLLGQDKKFSELNDTFFNIQQEYIRKFNDPTLALPLTKVELNKLINTPWGRGKWQYKESIWSDNANISRLLDKSINKVITGQNISTVAHEITDIKNVSTYQSLRLLRTETTRVINQANIVSFEVLGFKKVRYIATLDDRTSYICTDLHDSKFKVHGKNKVKYRETATKKRSYTVDGLKIGFNVPPMHPNCRSIIVPVK